jgi:ParB family chromosome partitioning protein
MELKHIEIGNLKATNVNVRKVRGKDVADLVPSIRSLGIIQPLLVRPNCEGYEIVAGQRRYNALLTLAEEGATIEPVPCIVMEDGDDAKAIEASLAENVARLPMDEIDQYKAFAALSKQGRSVEDIAIDFGVTERLVKQRLAIANLIAPILNAYRKEEIDAATVRALTLATKRQQKAWWDLFTDENQRAPLGRALKSWLFGGADIPVQNALFDVGEYDGATVTDLFGEDSYFDDAEKFWTLQNNAIAKAKEAYLADGWSDVAVLDVGVYWSSWEYVATAKEDGGGVYVQIARDGEVSFHEGFLTEKEAKRKSQAEQGTESLAAGKSELTKPMQNYLALHRHSAVRTELLSHADVALRLAVTQIIAGSDLWNVRADPQKAGTDEIADSLAANKAERAFSEERQRIRALLGIEAGETETLVPRKEDWGRIPDLHAIFAKLVTLNDADVMAVLTFVVAETLPSGSSMVEALGTMFNADMADHWSVDEIFLDLLRDKEAINACLKEVAGKATADAHLSSTAKVQKKVISDCLDGTRTSGKKDWQPRYMAFPMRAYTKRGCIAAIDDWKTVRKHYV